MRDGRAPFHPRSLAPAKLQRRVSPRDQNSPTEPHALRRTSPARRGTTPPSSASVQGSFERPRDQGLMLSRDHEVWRVAPVPKVVFNRAEGARACPELAEGVPQLESASTSVPPAALNTEGPKNQNPRPFAQTARDKDGVPGLLSFTSWAATPAAQDLRGGSTQRAGRSVHRYVR